MKLQFNRSGQVVKSFIAIKLLSKYRMTSRSQMDQVTAHGAEGKTGCLRGTGHTGILADIGVGIDVKNIEDTIP